MTNVMKLFREDPEKRGEPDHEYDSVFADLGYGRRHENAPPKALGAPEDEWGLDEPIEIPPRPKGWKPPPIDPDEIPWPLNAPWLR